MPAPVRRVDQQGDGERSLAEAAPRQRAGRRLVVGVEHHGTPGFRGRAGQARSRQELRSDRLGELAETTP